jgi:hypothetical protein
MRERIRILPMIAALGGAALAAAPGPEVVPWKPAGISTNQSNRTPPSNPRTGDLYFVRSSPQFTGWRSWSVTAQQLDGQQPRPPPFAGDGVEADPWFAPDGRSLLLHLHTIAERREAQGPGHLANRFATATACGARRYTCLSR